MAKGIESGKERSSGKPASEEEADKAAEENEAPAEVDLPDVTLSTFHRMRTDWRSADAAMLREINSQIDTKIVEEFSDAFILMNDLYDVVREVEVHPSTKQPLIDEFGFRTWKRTRAGAYVEDWSKLTYHQREWFLHRLVVSQFDWEQRAARIWSEAMFAKAIWQERFAREFDAPAVGTVDDRNARGHMNAAEERYFALYVSSLSRRAEALCRTLNNLALRLRDTMQS